MLNVLCVDFYVSGFEYTYSLQREFCGLERHSAYDALSTKDEAVLSADEVSTMSRPGPTISDPQLAQLWASYYDQASATASSVASRTRYWFRATCVPAELYGAPEKSLHLLSHW